jgi:hypothetical protein
MKSTRMRWAGHMARKKEIRNLFKILIGNLGYKRPFGD